MGHGAGAVSCQPRGGGGGLLPGPLMEIVVVKEHLCCFFWCGVFLGGEATGYHVGIFQ